MKHYLGLMSCQTSNAKERAFMINFNSGNFPTHQISNSVATKFVRLRGLYSYPAAYIERAPKSTADIHLAGPVYGRFVVPAVGNIANLWLDDYHHELLRSKSQSESLLGLASVVYWGYFTFGDKFARKRVNRLLHGYRGVPGVTASAAYGALQTMIGMTNVGATGAALGELHGLSQLGRTPFGSKVVAFLSPSLAGIFDNRICNGLQDQPWALPFLRGIGEVHKIGTQEAYQAWCLYLSLIASHLNAGIQAGNKNWRWNCGEDVKQEWRALDVERAFFAAYAPIGKPSHKKSQQKVRSK
jgi:hypothetical protein